MANTLKDSILAHIAQDEMIGLSKDLVNIPSYTTDETEVANLIVWPSLLERQRQVVLSAGLLACRGGCSARAR